LSKHKKIFNFEPFNFVAEDGDSIYYPPLKELKDGQIYVSEDKIRDIVTDELSKRFGPALNNNNGNV
jgi:hypothetical protein